MNNYWPWWAGPWYYTRRRRPDWFDKLSGPRQAAILILTMVAMPFAAVAMGMGLIYFIAYLIFEPRFWLFLLLFVIWAVFQK